MLKGARRILKKYGLPYCWHKWNCVNVKEANGGHRPIFKCSRCGEYLT